MSKTGGGRGTNQHRVKGRSVAQPGSARSRYGSGPARADVDLGRLPAEEVSQSFTAVPMQDVVLLEPGGADLARFSPTSPERALARYVDRRADYAYSSAYLEGNTFTLPEVYTLLDGVVPGGKERDDVDQVLALTTASEELVDQVQTGTFHLDLETSDRLNGLLARHEAIDAGTRRSRSRINSDGRGAVVNVLGDEFTGYTKQQLHEAEPVLLERTERIGHPVLRAVNYASLATYMQMYLDGNKRTARYMADGELMNHGFDAIAIPARRRDEYHQSLAAMFRSGDTSPYALFLLDVAARGDAVADGGSGTGA